MIEIKPTADAGLCREFLKNIAVHDNTFVLAAFDGDCVVGAGVLRLFPSHAVLEHIAVSPGYEMLDYGIGKAMLNFVERRDIVDVVCGTGVSEHLLRRLGFHTVLLTAAMEPFAAGQHVTYLNLRGYFTKHC